jgi:4-hydroxy-4-methyl-2-oxoglutarate aldolase
MPTRVHRPVVPLSSSDLVARWGAVPTTIATDLFRGRNLIDPAIRPIRAFVGRRRLVGRAVTAWCEPADYGPVHHAIAIAQAGDVIAIDAGGRLDVAVIGELLCGAARRKGIGGVVVDGAVRDIGTLTLWDDFAVFARGSVARGALSMERGAVNDTIVLGKVSMSPGDLVVGDDDGLVTIARDQIEEKLRSALAMVEAERQWEHVLSQGQTTLEVFKVPAPVSSTDGGD